jgi:motility quorum-sensing regulator / GCU-specific mRNA interferase toxin
MIHKLMEKRKPHYELKTLKEFFYSETTRLITGSAHQNAASIGYMGVEDMLAVINRLCPEDFYKSMTTIRSHRVWQDVYRYQDDNGNNLYIKLQLSSDGSQAVLIQMKRDEREEESR